jgi:hypothetical protein
MQTARTIAIGDIHGCSAALDALLIATRKSGSCGGSHSGT